MSDSLYPCLYQLNTRVTLTRLSAELGRPATLDDIPDRDLDELANLGFDWIYALGVWETGAVGRDISRSNLDWWRDYVDLLPDLEDADIGGSCFAITRYTLSDRLGDEQTLLRLRDRLHQRGLKLMLDFVPNHTACDAPWVLDSPDYYIQGTPADLKRDPHNYFLIGDRIFAHGRDLYFPGWPDTLQLNYNNPAVPETMLGELSKIAGLCDGLRCDMAMLILPEIFEQIWGRPIAPFWPDAIHTVRDRYPDFTFMAEVYWDLEWELQQQGFDYTYDKRLYDRLCEGDARPVREHFWADLDYQNKSARFLENHDEPRAVSVFGPGKHQAAAILTYLCPGLRFFHQGQLQGWAKKVSIHLCRAPEQLRDRALAQFYEQLLACLRLPVLRKGNWQLLECTPAQAGDGTWEQFVAFAWTEAGERKRLLVAVNYAPEPGRCCVRLPVDNDNYPVYHFGDRMSSPRRDRDGNNLLRLSLSLDLPPWGYTVFDIDPAT